MRKRSVVLFAHATSVSLENEFWDMLQTLACEQGKSLSSLIAQIDKTRTTGLSSALRLYVLRELKKYKVNMPLTPTDKA